jgi:hypothetical protein
MNHSFFGAFSAKLMEVLLLNSFPDLLLALENFQKFKKLFLDALNFHFYFLYKKTPTPPR